MALWFKNKKREGRFKSSLVDTQTYFLVCMRYIELNPVRAGMNEIPGEDKWSSYQANGYGKKFFLPPPQSFLLILDSISENK